MAEGYITQVSRTNPQAAPVATPPPKAAPASRSPWAVISGWFCCTTAPPQGGQQQAGPSLSQTSRRPGDKLLGPILAQDENKKCLVLDLDETLVHSSFKPVPNADFVVPVEIEGHIHHVYVLKRPYVDLFLKKLGELYEIVLFTASLPKYADPVADLLDTNRVFRHRLFREHCVVHEGTYVKDLSRLGRDMKQVIIVDNSPASYAFQPENAVPVESWFEDEDDRELYDLIPFFEEIAKASDISQIRH